jgi:hypothetical protein
MDPDDFRRRVIQVSAIAGVIILVSAMESILMYYASRFDKVPRHTSSGILSGQDRVNELRRTSDEEMVRDNPLVRYIHRSTTFFITNYCTGQ